MPGPHADHDPLPDPPKGHASIWRDSVLEKRYRVEERLGRGGMADVFKAVDERCGRPVVIKTPHVALRARSDFRQRFEKEIRSQTDLDHPRIAKVLDRGEHEGIPFVVIQYLAGGSLADRVEALPGGRTPAAVRAWLPEVAQALDHVHANGLIHRDVKPGNILFDEVGHVFLSDFGIAKAPAETDPHLTMPGVVLGTPGYVAPELGLGSTPTPASDQYALAVTVYEALSGDFPYPGRFPAAMLGGKRMVGPRPLAEVAPHVPPAVAAVVMRGLAIDPRDRYSSCEELAHAFDHAEEAITRPVPVSEAFRIPVPWLLFPVTGGLLLTVVLFLLQQYLSSR